jgi:hypothetical protein
MFAPVATFALLRMVAMPWILELIIVAALFMRPSKKMVEVGVQTNFDEVDTFVAPKKRIMTLPTITLGCLAVGACLVFVF